MTERKYHVLLAGIVLLGILGRCAHFYLTIGSDDQRYIIAARELGRPQSMADPTYYHRVVFRLALAIWGVPFGLSLKSSAVLMFLLACLSILLVALITKRIFGPQASLLAALLQATYPINVLWDVVTLPDNLAAPMMLGSILCFLVFLQRRSKAGLCAASFLAGLAWGIKEFYPLVFLPYMLCLLALDGKKSQKAGYAALALACFVLGLSMDVMLHAWDSGNPLRHFRLAQEYSEGVVVRFLGGDAAPTPGTTLSQRGLYVQALLIDYGPAGGTLLLAGGLFLAFQWRRMECRLLALVGGVLFLFLSLAPVKLRPLAFVETQVRYSVSFLPILAVGAGGVCARVYGMLQDALLRRLLAVTLAILCAISLWIPGFKLDTNCRFACVAITRCLQRGREFRLSRLMLPSDFKTRLPESYAAYGIPLRFGGQGDFTQWEHDVVTDLLDSEQGFGVFVPRGFTKLEYPAGKKGPWKDIGELLASRGFRPIEVRVPGSTPGAWLDWLGRPTRGVAAGVLYLKPQEATKQ